MKQTNPENQQPDIDDAVRARIVARAAAINGILINRLATISDDLGAGRHRAALGGLDGTEREINTMRSLLLLLP